MGKKVRLIDTTKCMACRACQVACKSWNQLPAVTTTFTGSYENPADFTPETWCRVKFNEHESGGKVNWYFNFYSCMHCEEAGCMDVCPANAIHRTAMGTVKIDPETCIACGLCVTACPFDIPRVGELRKNAAWKCTSCFDRISNGLSTACASACSTKAITFGDREEMVAQAEARLSYLQDKGVAGAQLYGKDELGGLAVIYVLADSPDKYGLPSAPALSSNYFIWKTALAPVRTLATVGLAAGALFRWYDMRCQEQLQEK